MSMWSLVRWRAGQTPDAEMLVDETGRRVSFREFHDRAERVAAALHDRGVGQDTPVTWQLPTTVAALVLTAALARLGAVQNPVLPKLDPRFMVEQTGAQLLVLDVDLPESWPPPPFAEPVGDPVRWIFYTSGTTTDPKGAKHTDASVLASARCMGERLGCTPADRVGMVFPVAHIGGCGTWLGACLMYGCTLILDSAFEADRTIELQRRERVTLAGSGTVFTQIYLAAQRRQPNERLFPHVRALTSGAAPKPPTLHTDVKRELGGVGVLSGYGLTEAPILTMCSPTDSDEALATTEGRPAEGVDLRVVDGELRVKGPQVMVGYVDTSLDAFDADGYLRTGDLGRIDEDGNVTITGRLKDIIIRKGENISAPAIEEAVSTHPGVADVAVIGLADPERGEMACAVIVPKDGHPVPTLPRLIAFLLEHGVPTRLWPERLAIVDQLPRNATGKVLKAELRQRIG
jgi:acyl-CoA synthetase (AMP-forming)/AMP-acid ligase II